MRTSKECRATRREIDETLPDQDLARQALDHVAACASCRDFQNQQQRLAELVSSLQPVSAPADFDMRLRARLTKQNGRTRSWLTVPSFAFGRSAIAVAATVVLVGTVALLNQWGVIRRASGPAVVVSQPARPGNDRQPTTQGIAESQTTHPVIGTANSDQRVNRQPKNPKPNGSLKRSAIRSDDFAMLPAPSITRYPDEQNAAVISGKPFEFSLQDKQGVTRRFSLPPVSFGSQQLVQRGQPYQSASYSGNRIW